MAAGCAQSMPAVQRGLANDGYAMWYPPDASLEPGQVWLADTALRVKFADRPAALPVSTSNQELSSDAWAPFADIQTSFSSEFTSSTLSKAGPFAAELYAGT